MKILLIRNTYGSGRWNLPGGRIEKNETPEYAIQREVHEELGIEVPSIHFLGVVMSAREYKKDSIYCFSSNLTEKDFVIEPEEIAEAGWFPLDSIPNNTASIVYEVMKLHESAFV